MPSRRSFIKSAGLVPLAAAGVVPAAVAAQEGAKPYAGPHELPRNLTALAIKQKDGSETLGVKTDKGIIDVVAAAKLLKFQAPATLEDLLADGNAAGLVALVKAAQTSPKAKPAILDEAKITHGRLFADPAKIVCIGLNYRAHIAETGEKVPKVPILFNKFNNALAPHNVVLKLPPKDVAYKYDYETELLIVIGKFCRNVPESAALEYVAGYSIGHDFSARDLQLETGGQWMIGKTLDDFAPIGPYFVSADLVGDPNDLKIETRVNGEIRQSATTRDMIFDCKTLISYISKHFELDPGDIIFTGTPPGVILGMAKDKQIWLKPGDKIESSIEKLGKLKFELA
ncbi:MAG: fumarylacetoacetate hydrolase family protein [Methylovirgula sp.]